MCMHHYTHIYTLEPTSWPLYFILKTTTSIILRNLVIQLCWLESFKAKGCASRLVVFWQSCQQIQWQQSQSGCQGSMDEPGFPWTFSVYLPPSVYHSKRTVTSASLLPSKRPLPLSHTQLLLWASSYLTC